MTDDDIRAAYLKAIGNPMDERLMEQARLFIAAIFDALQPAGFIDCGIFSEEEWGVRCPEALYRRPF
jgi:hypothetical protein